MVAMQARGSLGGLVSPALCRILADYMREWRWSIEIYGRKNYERRKYPDGTAVYFSR
jgi:hypothetical protein